MDLDLTVAQRIIRDTAAESIKRELEPITSDSNRSRDRKWYCIKETTMAKGFAMEAAIRTCYDAIRILDGYGTIQKYPVERSHRDVRVTSSYFGTSEIKRLIIARELTQ